MEKKLFSDKGQAKKYLKKKAELARSKILNFKENSNKENIKNVFATVFASAMLITITGCQSIKDESVVDSNIQLIETRKGPGNEYPVSDNIDSLNATVEISNIIIDKEKNVWVQLEPELWISGDNCTIVEIRFADDMPISYENSTGKEIKNYIDPSKIKNVRVLEADSTRYLITYKYEEDIQYFGYIDSNQLLVNIDVHPRDIEKEHKYEENIEFLDDKLNDETFEI